MPRLGVRFFSWALCEVLNRSGGGMNTGSPVSTAYNSPNSFSGRLNSVTIGMKATSPAQRGEIEGRERDVTIRKAISD
jgi:hypothetical protein